MLNRLSITSFFVTAMLVTFCAGLTQRAIADVTIVENGQAKAALFVTPELMADNVKIARSEPLAKREAETHRQMLRDAVRDFAAIVKRMSGVELLIKEGKPGGGEKLLPILVGDLAQEQFGKPEVESEFRQGYRIVVTDKAVGLIGQTGESNSYALYTVLDQLGCRWFIPGEIGEHLPAMKTITLKTGDTSAKPDTGYRGIWYCDADFRRRNRMGGFRLNAGHALDRMISEEDLEKHPEWNAERNGERKINSGFLCWGNPEVAKAVSETIIGRLDENYVDSVSLSPKDGVAFCQCDEFCKPLDAGDWDPTMGTVSITDRYIVFCNRIAEHVGKKHPDVKFGFLAYVQYTRAPVREKPHPNLIPQIAPITYCRAHSINSENCDSRQIMRSIIEGWNKSAKRLSYYNYMFHLAETAVPYPMIRQMSDEMPVLYGGTAKMLWQPETMANFESVAPGMYMTNRMSWDNSLKPAAIMDEYFTQFHGNAAEAMRKYWTIIDNAWMDVDEHAGCGFGHAKRFTPETMKAARDAMNEALAAAKTTMEYRRVQLFNDSFINHERFMKMRGDLAEARLTHLGRDAMTWMGVNIGNSEKYEGNYTYSRAGWASMATISAGYFNAFFKKTYDDAGRIAGRRSGYAFLTRFPGAIKDWQYTFIEKSEDPSETKDTTDTIEQGEAKGYHKADFDDSSWKKTDSAVDTWSSLGLLGKYGTMWYRTTVSLQKLKPEKKIYLWISATDGSAKVFINGNHVKYVTDAGEEKDVANGYCTPFSFDVTEYIKSGEKNQITIAGTRLFINELGTGGLLGPAYLYVEK